MPTERRAGSQAGGPTRGAAVTLEGRPLGVKIPAPRDVTAVPCYLPPVTSVPVRVAGLPRLSAPRCFYRVNTVALSERLASSLSSAEVP